ncbi:MAG: hypothetical protein L3K17_10030 [Thermoplasmata archaeon]|nr:hypothetical protein [Thermoplasmata archaeon]
MIDWISKAIILPEVHIAIGMAVVFGSYLLLPGPWKSEEGPSHLRYARFGVVAFAVLVCLKELLWDPVNEVNNPFFWQGIVDLGWYCVGIFTALGLIFARHQKL